MDGYTLQSVRLRTGSDDSDARLVFAEGELVAVIALLSDPNHGDLRGLWNIEVDFQGLLITPPLFSSPHEAVQWVLGRHKEATSG